MAPYSPMQRRSRHRHASEFKHTLLTTLHGLPRLRMYGLALTYTEMDVVPFLWNGFDTLVEYSYVIPIEEKETWILFLRSLRTPFADLVGGGHQSQGRTRVHPSGQ